MSVLGFPALLTALCAVTISLAAMTTADEPSGTKETDPDSRSGLRESTIHTLRPLGTLIGEWKGVGQPKRGSNAGAWSEKVLAAWRFESESADLVMTFEPGQQFHYAAFSVAEDRKTPLLTLTPLAGDAVKLTRTPPTTNEKLPTESWIFESTADNWPQTRCTVRIISEIRLTMLFEEKQAEKSSYRRLSEIGLTRAGTRLANGNTGERLCIVTGGLGTIKVAYEGKSYYVCCEGCKQAFDADPKGTIEAWLERQQDAAKPK